MQLKNVWCKSVQDCLDNVDLGLDFFCCRFKCPDCDKVFRSELGFQQHRSVHLGSMVQCSVCTEMFVRWEAYLSRLWPTLPQKSLSGEKLSCPDCGKRFNRSWVSSNTVLSTWAAWSSALSAQKCSSGMKLSCPDCGKTFRSGLGL